MRRIVGVALWLCAGIGIAVGQDQAKVVKISDSIYMASTTGNVYLIVTPAGNVVIDTALAAGRKRAQIARVRLRKPRNSCLRKVRGR